MANISKAASKFGATVGLTGAPVFTQSKNIIDLIVDDHKYAKSLYEKFKTTPNVNEKIDIRNTLVKTLVQHDECEQLLVYPLLREKVGGPEGEEQYRRSLQEHQELRHLMYAVKYTDLKANPKEFHSKITAAMDYLFHHIEQEENEVLPLLRKHVSEEELKKVGASFNAHKPTAATRPHPNAPAQGFPAAVANVLTKPIDKARDLLEGVQ
ncbi:hypothetical protein BDF20DRAFT_915729 [Mycotypha africana]|uniref:uncharacterized protein n=1 Tax=Mycotypha africana TaxID=64632 RepID=UPI0023000913|nr:uncharacterized protein BDF20DRAFT_915729 [Mycotypha africana]KAI8971987.1 hypothetical protein BDF20DRAFT_915729 [Mycotypha africana]